MEDLEISAEMALVSEGQASGLGEGEDLSLSRGPLRRI